VSVRGRPVRPAPLAWLPWAAAGLVLALVLLSIITARALANGSNDAARDSAPAVATVAGQPLLPLTRGDLSGVSGAPVELKGARVESVVSDEGFWVGNDADERVFVFLTPQARATAGGSPLRVEDGGRVTLSGALRPLPAEAEPFGVDDGRGRDQLRRQGQYVEATAISAG
jgi:hypothetical protein